MRLESSSSFHHPSVGFFDRSLISSTSNYFLKELLKTCHCKIRFTYFAKAVATFNGLISKRPMKQINYSFNLEGFS
jgi:hypothetical protein